MKISVIVPVYNCESYLRQCMDSLVNQTIDDIEILMVDDGSTDGSLSILKEYESKHSNKIKVFTKENGGQASARNLGLEYATGEYLGFVDSDDWVDLEMYEEMYALAKKENSDIVICDMVDHYPTHEIYHQSAAFSNKFTVTPSACNKIFKREFVEKIQFPVGLWYEDFEYTTKALLLTDNISCIKKGFYHCHCREVSTMSNDNSPKNLNIIEVVNHLIDFAEEKGVFKQYESDFQYIILEHILVTTVNRVTVQNHPEKKNVLRELIAYSKKMLPSLKEIEGYRNYPRNRKIIACLNYYGLYNVSKTLLELKKR